MKAAGVNVKDGVCGQRGSCEERKRKAPGWGQLGLLGSAAQLGGMLVPAPVQDGQHHEAVELSLLLRTGEGEEPAAGRGALGSAIGPAVISEVGHRCSCEGRKRKAPDWGRWVGVSGCSR